MLQMQKKSNFSVELQDKRKGSGEESEGRSEGEGLGEDVGECRGRVEGGWQL
jgi:hypothetical protein